MSIKHVVSISTGKDSDSTLLIAIDRFGKKNVIAILCDTGNEHEEVFRHKEYLERELGIDVVVLRASFENEIAAKREYIARDVRTRREYDTKPVFDANGEPVPKRDGRGNIVMKKSKRGGIDVMLPVQKTVKIGGGKRVRWTNKAKRRALAVLYPTGNPFLDLCLWKGRFPSRKAQFCTEHLKRNMAVEFQLELVEQGHTVVSWQGIRRDESLNRRNAKKFECIGPSMYAYRPIVDWAAEDTFAFIAAHGLEPNDLYRQGMGRVGCMPCINASKEELNQIARRFPGHVARISEWESLVERASKWQAATFIPAPQVKFVTNTRQGARDNGIWSVIEWAKTTRGGKQFNLLGDLEDISACSSAYGLCE